MSFLCKYYKLSAFLSGALSVLIFAPYFQIWAGFIAFSILFCLLCQSQSKLSSAAIGYWFGFAHFALGFAWIGNALLIDSAQFGWLYPLALLASGAFFGLFTMFPAFLTGYATSPWSKWLLFVGGWGIAEWLRSFILTGFPWNLLGYSLAFDLKLIQLAAVGGAYLVSLVAVMLYTLGGVYLALPRKQNLLTCFLVAATLVFCLYGFGYYRLQNTSVNPLNFSARIVQPSIPQSMKWSKQTAEDNFAKYLTLSATANQTNPDLIIWGETASPFMLDRDEIHRRKASSILPPQSILLTGMISYQYVDGKYMPHNSMAAIDAQGNIIGYYHKSHLVPFGEYIPLRRYLPDFVRPVANFIGEFGRGNRAETMSFNNGLKIGTAICYEIIFPHQIIDEKNRPDLLINLTNDGWYGDSSGPYQHWVTTRFRAVEEGIGIIRAANNGISGYINPLGEEKNVMQLNAVGVTDVIPDYPLADSTTYSWIGNRITIILCLILMLLGAIKALILKFSRR